MECPKCGNEVKDSDKKCPYCGKVLKLECPVCHKYNSSSVCEECGNVIVVKCHQCGTPGPNTGKCRKCGFSTAKSVIMNEAETEEYACLAITFPNLEDLRPALKNKQIFNKFKKKLKQALFGYAASQDNRAQTFGETYVIKYYKEFSFTSSVKKAVKSAIELLNKIGGISYKLKRSKNVRLHCKMTILKKTFETDNNEFNTGLNIKLIKDTTVEKYTDGLQLITDQYINNIISRDYTLEMIYSSQVGDELLMFYEFPLEDQIIPIVIEDEKKKEGLLTGKKELPKLKIYDDEDDKLDDILYGNKAIDISTAGQFLSVPVHNIFNVLSDLLKAPTFIALKTTERRDIPTGELLNFIQSKSAHYVHIVCKEDFKYKPYTFFRAFFARLLKIDLKQKNIFQKISKLVSKYENAELIANLLNNAPSEELDPDAMYLAYLGALREFLSKQKNTYIFVENFDLIDDSSLKIINDYISSIINIEDYKLTFIATSRSEYSIYKNIPKLLHSTFYKEINVTKGDYLEFLKSVPESKEEIINSFYIQKLEERSAGSLIYFKNLLQYLRDINVFITFEDKLIINAEKTIVFPGTLKELFANRFSSLPESEGLVMAYTTLLGGSTHISLLESLGIENFSESVENLVNKNLIGVNESIIEIYNFRIFKPALMKVLTNDIKNILIKNIIKSCGYVDYEYYKILGDRYSMLETIYDLAKTDLLFGDFNSYLNCAKLYFSIIDEYRIDDEDVLSKRNELYSILVNHLNRYPSTKVYSISKAIMSNAIANNDDETIVNVSNLILDSALNGGDYVLAEQCIQNILTRILNPKLLGENQDLTPQFLLYSCIHAKITFHLSRYSQCVAICDKILSILSSDVMSTLERSGVDRMQLVSYVMEIFVYSALSRILICDGSLDEFLNNVKDKIGNDILSSEYLRLLDKLFHKEEVEDNVGITNDDMSLFISNILNAFKNFSEGYNIFAQNIYKAKLSAQGDDMRIFSLVCDLLIGYSYQKINLEKYVSWKKSETIYDDVARIAQKAGYSSVIQLTNWFKASLLKDKGEYESAYEMVVALSNALKRQRIKNRVLSLITYILTLNITANLPNKRTEIPILVYRIKYEGEKYGLEEYYSFVEDQRVLDPEYMEEFKEAIEKEQAMIEAEQVAEAEADAEEEQQIQKDSLPIDNIQTANEG